MLVRRRHRWKNGARLRLRPSAPTACTPTAAIPMRCATPRPLTEDVQRRDFTINGLLLDPLRGGSRLDEFFAD